MIQNRIPTLVVAATLACLFAGCETASTSTGAKNAKAGAATEYEYVTPLGSNIPVRVPKGTKAASATSPTEAMTGEQAADMLSRGGSVSGDRGR